MTTGIKITNCTNMQFINVEVRNAETAFDISDSENIELENILCQSNRVAVAVDRVKGLQAANVTHQSDWHAQPKSLAESIRRATYGYV